MADGGIKAIVFDLDGTLYFGDQIAEEAVEALSILRREGCELFFLTNNSSKTRREVWEKLLELGIEAEENRLYTSACATARYAAETGVERAFVLGSVGLRSELEAAGVRSVPDPECDAVVVGMAREIRIDDLAVAMEALLRRDARLIVANVDRNFPSASGRILPGANAVVAALLGSLDREISYEMVGKPEPVMLEMICRDHGMAPDRLCLVGDREESDAEAARRFGSSWRLVDSRGMSRELAHQLMEQCR
jgi:HAD superfamily hydrolase (TIGR01450 family)